MSQSERGGSRSRTAYRPPAPGRAAPVLPRKRTEPKGPSEEATNARNLAEWVLVLVGAVVLAMVIRGVAFQTFKIPSGSMEPTLYRGDRVVVNKLSFKVGDIDRGDVVVFERPPNLIDTADHLIKRVIGLPGDTVASSGDGGLTVNGQRLSEPWLADGTRTDWVGCAGSFKSGDRESVSFSCGQTLGTITVPEGQVLVLGDNRANSNDGRVFGPISQDLVVGRAFVKIWPLDRVGGM